MNKRRRDDDGVLKLNKTTQVTTSPRRAAIAYEAATIAIHSTNAHGSFGRLSSVAETAPHPWERASLVNLIHGETAFSSRRATDTGKATWPLTAHAEARLLRYFVNVMAPCLDLCDTARHFGLVVPQRAITCPTLMNAILAISARHLSRISNYDATVADKYLQKCLRHLIPRLNDKVAIMDENLLAATIVLRFMEEVDVPVSGTGLESHLLGTHAFMSAQQPSTSDSGLRQASYWIGLRQEYYVAFINRRTIAAAFDNPAIDQSFADADDCTWANRMVAASADAVRYCFGNGGSDVVRYTALIDYLNQWMLQKPTSFSHVYYKKACDENVLPEVWLINDYSICALQHYHLAQILLATHDPRVPEIGPGRKAALQASDVSQIAKLRRYSRC